jgi:SAM-dependent methyltransferase
MIKSKPWPWDSVPASRLKEPVEAVYYLAERWKQAGKSRLLDLGCGTGRHALFFAARGFTVDAFDLSTSGIVILKQTAAARDLTVRTQVGDMLALPYENSSFDCLLAYHVIFHTDRSGIERALSEVHRVLAPGGEAYITFNSKNSPVFSDPTNERIDENTLIKTHGVEAGIPHYFVDTPEVRRLLASFEFLQLSQVERITDNHTRCHYHVLVRKGA